MKTMEEYFSADRLLELDIGSVFQINEEGKEEQYTVCLIGVDNNHSVVMTLPLQESLPDGTGYSDIFKLNTMFEMKTIHNGRIVAFESSIEGTYGERMLISSFPEMIETRRVRVDTRYPCALSCDIRQGDLETYGVITDISLGGCQITVEKNENFEFLSFAMESQEMVELDVFFPFSETPIQILTKVKSSVCQIDGACKVGASFVYEYESIRKYLDSLQLYSVSPFFS